MSRNSCDHCGGIQDAHTADCPNRVDDRAVVVAEALAVVERVLRERLNEVMISAQSSLAEDRCEVLHPDEYSPERGECVECTEHAADLLHDGWDEQIVAPVLNALTALDLPAQRLTCGHPNHGAADHYCQPFRTPGAPA